MLKQFSLVFFVLLGCYIGVNYKELKHLTNELEVHVPASEVWDLYRILGIAKLGAQQLKDVVQSLEVLRGDAWWAWNYHQSHFCSRSWIVSNKSGNSSYTENFTVIDDQKRVEVTQGLEGDCIENGCSSQNFQFDIIEKSKNSSIIKSDISYAVKRKYKAKDPKPNIQLLVALAQVAKECLETKKACLNKTV